MTNELNNSNRSRNLEILGWVIVLVVAAAAIFFMASWCYAATANINAEQLHKKLDSKGKFQLVDVREKWEYDQGHIPGAKLIPLRNIINGDFKLNKDKEVVVYCHSGRRSSIAAAKLGAMGFKDIKNLKGGIMKWNYELTDKVPQKTINNKQQEVTK